MWSLGMITKQQGTKGKPHLNKSDTLNLFRENGQNQENVILPACVFECDGQHNYNFE